MFLDAVRKSREILHKGCINLSDYFLEQQFIFCNIRYLA